MSTPILPPEAPATAETRDTVTGWGRATNAYFPIDGAGRPIRDAGGHALAWTAGWRLAPIDADPMAGAPVAFLPAPAGDMPAKTPSGDAGHPLDSAPAGTTAIKTTSGTVTLAADFGSVSAPDPTDAIHTSATPAGTTLQKTEAGIEVQAKVPSGFRAELGYALHAVKATVAEALAWLEKEWREKVEHKAA